jgi:hypothetical protein
VYLQLCLGLDCVTVCAVPVVEQSRRSRKKHGRKMRTFDLFRRPIYTEDELYYAEGREIKMIPQQLAQLSTELFLREVRKFARET